MIARSDDGGAERRFRAIARLDGPIEVEYLRQGGILPAVLRRLARELTGGSTRSRPGELPDSNRSPRREAGGFARPRVLGGSGRSPSPRGRPSWLSTRRSGAVTPSRTVRKRREAAATARFRDRRRDGGRYWTRTSDLTDVNRAL